ncbi:MAG: 50S ribosomal protein L29 [Patescibacteria group bacterium]|nr:50S ribosomal protein L29 [Patescibacteria group bacterium]
MKAKDQLKQLRGSSVKNLISDLKKHHDKLRLIYFNVKFRKQKNNKEAKAIKRQIARIWTIINEKTYLEAETKLGKSEKGVSHE